MDQRCLERTQPCNPNYQSDVYKTSPSNYDREVVWQFRGRAAEASWTEKSGALFYCPLGLKYFKSCTYIDSGRLTNSTMFSSSKYRSPIFNARRSQPNDSNPSAR